MCIAAPGRVKSIKGREARVEYPGVGVRRAMVGVPVLKRGEWVLVQMGIVIQVVEKKDAKKLESEWQNHASA